jgi:hypothetical protein
MAQTNSSVPFVRMRLVIYKTAALAGSVLHVYRHPVYSVWNVLASLEKSLRCHIL